MLSMRQDLQPSNLARALAEIPLNVLVPIPEGHEEAGRMIVRC